MDRNAKGVINWDFLEKYGFKRPEEGEYNLVSPRNPQMRSSLTVALERRREEEERDNSYKLWLAERERAAKLDMAKARITPRDELATNTALDEHKPLVERKAELLKQMEPESMRSEIEARATAYLIFLLFEACVAGAIAFAICSFTSISLWWIVPMLIPLTLAVDVVKYLTYKTAKWGWKVAITSATNDIVRERGLTSDAEIGALTIVEKE